jgi:hypothetical protein
MNSEDYLSRSDLAPLKKRRYWYVLTVTLCILGLLMLQPLLFLAGLCILMIGVVPEVWYRVALRRLEIQQSIDRQQHFFGDEAVLTQRFENHKWLPATWLKVEAFITPPLTIIDVKTAQRIKDTHEQRYDAPSDPAILGELTRAYMLERYAGEQTDSLQRLYLHTWVPHLVQHLVGSNVTQSVRRRFRRMFHQETP